MRIVFGWSALFLLLLGLVVGCAHVERPPGGPEDLTAPQLLATRPDSLEVIPDFSDRVVLVFDERVSERGLNQLVEVSPRTSTVQVDHRRDELRVSLRQGWEPGTIYHVTVLPDLQDLFGNRREEPVSFVFSTGPDIPDTYLQGTVVDRVTGRPEVGIRVEAIRQTDSLVYTLPTDSAGAFRFARVPTGEYQIRSFQDMNRNRALDEFEPRDSAFTPILVGDTAFVELGILMPDSTPAVIESITVRDGVMEIEFDDYLDPAQRVNAGRVNISGPGGQFVAVAAARIGSAPPAPGADTLDAPAQPADTTAADDPLPSRSIFLRLAGEDPLTPEAEYVVTVFGVRNINGLSADAEGTFTAEAPAPAAPAGEEGDEPGDDDPDADADADSGLDNGPELQGDGDQTVAMAPLAEGQTVSLCV